MILRDETRVLDKKKTREADLHHVAKQLNGRLSPDDLRRLITVAADKRSPDGWLRTVLEAETWNDELR